MRRASFAHSVWSLITLPKSFSSIMKFSTSLRNSRLISAPGGQISTSPHFQSSTVFLCLAKIILHQKWRPSCSSVLIFLFYLMLMFWVCVWTMVWLVSQITLKWGNVFLEFQGVIFGCSGVTSPHSLVIVCAWSEVEEIITALITAREEKNIHITCIIHWTMKSRFQTITPLQITYS